MFDVQIVDLPEFFDDEFGVEVPYTLNVRMPEDDYDPYSLIAGISIAD